MPTLEPHAVALDILVVGGADVRGVALDVVDIGHGVLLGVVWAGHGVAFDVVLVPGKLSATSNGETLPGSEFRAGTHRRLQVATGPVLSVAKSIGAPAEPPMGHPTVRVSGSRHCGCRRAQRSAWRASLSTSGMMMVSRSMTTRPRPRGRSAACSRSGGCRRSSTQGRTACTASRGGLPSTWDRSSRASRLRRMARRPARSRKCSSSTCPVSLRSSWVRPASSASRSAVSGRATLGIPNVAGPSSRTAREPPPLPIAAHRRAATVRRRSRSGAGSR